MKNLSRCVLLVTFLLTFSNCASVPKTYHLWAGGRADVYTEKSTTPIDQTLAALLGGTVTTTAGDPSKMTSTAYGGQIGLTEQIGATVTTLGIYYQKYSPIKYSFNSSSYGAINETMNITGWGLDGTIGWNISIFRPGIGYKYESQTFETSVSGSSLTTPMNTKTSTSSFLLGPSLAFDIPIGKAHLVLQGDYRFPISTGSGVASANSIIVQTGFRIGGWEVK